MIIYKALTKINKRFGFGRFVYNLYLDNLLKQRRGVIYGKCNKWSN